MNSKSLFERYNEIQAIGLQIEVPWKVMNAMGARHLSIFGDQICIGAGDSDYVNLSEAREAINWYVQQLGGTVKWSKK